MKQVGEYRANADQCRRIAADSPDNHQRELLLTMAKQWEALAGAREELVATQFKLPPLD